MKDTDRLSNPLEYIITCCEQGLIPQAFDLRNAKDELKRLKDKVDIPYDNIAWSRINDRGDLYNPSFIHNPYLNQETVIPLYINKEEYKNFVEKLKKRLTD